MGTTFSNIHLKKNDFCSKETVENYYIQKMESIGYKIVKNYDDAEYVLLIETSSQSEWVSVDSNYFNLEYVEDMQKELNILSSEFNTDVIATSCMDSDFFMMNMVNSSENYDAWLNIGFPYYCIRRTTLLLWKKKIKNYFKFLSIFFKPHTFVEDAWFEIAELLNMDMNKGQCMIDSADFINCKKQYIYCKKNNIPFSNPYEDIYAVYFAKQ